MRATRPWTDGELRAAKATIALFLEGRPRLRTSDVVRIIHSELGPEREAREKELLDVIERFVDALETDYTHWQVFRDAKALLAKYGRK